MVNSDNQFTIVINTLNGMDMYKKFHMLYRVSMRIDILFDNIKSKNTKISTHSLP